jgi:hypothetical protein
MFCGRRKLMMVIMVIIRGRGEGFVVVVAFSVKEGGHGGLK